MLYGRVHPSKSWRKNLWRAPIIRPSRAVRKRIMLRRLFEKLQGQNKGRLEIEVRPLDLSKMVGKKEKQY